MSKCCCWCVVVVVVEKIVKSLAFKHFMQNWFAFAELDEKVYNQNKAATY